MDYVFFLTFVIVLFQFLDIIFTLKVKKQDCITAKDPCPPMAFSVPKRKKIWWCEEEEEGKKVSLKTHATARGVGKDVKSGLGPFFFFFFFLLHLGEGSFKKTPIFGPVSQHGGGGHSEAIIVFKRKSFSFSALF